MRWFWSPDQLNWFSSYFLFEQKLERHRRKKCFSKKESTFIVVISFLTIVKSSLFTVNTFVQMSCSRWPLGSRHFLLHFHTGTWDGFQKEKSLVSHLPAACQQSDTSEICRKDNVSSALYRFCTAASPHTCTSSCSELFSWKIPAAGKERSISCGGVCVRFRRFLAGVYLAALTGKQTVVVPRNFISTHWTELLQTHVTPVRHSTKQAQVQTIPLLICIHWNK